MLSSQAIFMFLWIRLSFIHKTYALSSLFSNCPVKKLVEPCWFMNFDGLTFLTASDLFNQSDYLNHFKKDSDWLIVACLIRVQRMLTTLLSALKIKFFFDNWKLYVSNLTDSSLQNKKNRLDCALFCCKAFFKQLECSRSGEKHSTTSRVSPYSSFVL